MVLCHEDGFDEQANLVAVLAESHGGLKPLPLLQGGNDDGYVNVAPRIWVPLE